MLKDVRIWFRKSGEAVYISHLDLNRTMLRAINGCGLDVWHTEGFNPHPFVTFALPLSLGIEGIAESMDVRLVSSTDEDTIINGLNEFLPESIRVFDVSDPVMKPKEIFMARFKIVFENDVTENLIKFLSNESIIVSKKTKSGVKEINVKEQILSYKAETIDKRSVLSIDLPAGTTANINPFLIMNKFNEELGIDEFFEVTRVGLFNEQSEAFK